MAPFLTALLPALGDIGKRVAGSLFPDPADEQRRLDAQQKFMTEVLAQAQTMELAAAEVVKAEAASSSWLASSWRPITMLVFVGLIVARWFGWAAPELTEAEYLKLWDIVQLGLGGYVIGRSAEKILPTVAEAIRR